MISVCRRAGVLALCLSVICLSRFTFAQTFPELDSLVFEPISLSQAVQRESLLPVRTRVKSGPVGTPVSYREPDSSLEQQQQIQTLEAYRQSLHKTELEQGTLAPELVEDMVSAARISQSLNEHQQALALLDRARHIVRVNEGLGSLTQVPIIEMRLDSLRATSNYETIEAEYQHLLTVLQEHYGPDNVNTVSAIQTLARWKLEVFHQGVRYTSRGDELPFDAGAFPTNDDIRQQAFETLEEAQRLMLDGIKVLVTAEAYDHPDLFALERDLIETYFLLGHREKLMSDPEEFLTHSYAMGDSVRSYNNMDSGDRTRAFRYGRNAYGRMLGYMRQRPEQTTVVEYAGVLAGLADWCLLFERQTEAYAQYRKAWELLKATETDEAWIVDILRPEVPVVLPTFTDTSYSMGQLVGEYKGYIDLEFKVKRYGRAGRVKVIGRSDGASDIVERHLLGMVRDSRFRPLVVDGELVEEDVQLRYYYDY